MTAKDRNFGPRLKELRALAGLSQKQLAERAGLSTTTVAALEQKLYDATWPTTQALAKALGVDCTAFTIVAKAAEKRKAGGKKKS